ncbi:hypothetical protein J25TS5_19290 [Paenibacillus faecis]|nr:hypothetical protein J25TS5_19290 [Paenibacillus faecis]
MDIRLDMCLISNRIKFLSSAWDKNLIRKNTKAAIIDENGFSLNRVKFGTLTGSTAQHVLDLIPYHSWLALDG